MLNVSPYVNPSETIWLKLENTSIRIFVVIYMYIWNLIITATCFPVNCIVLKVVENSYSTLYQQSNIIESGGMGVDVPNWTILRKYEASLYYLFYISWYKKNRFLYQEIHPISWYQNLIFWFKEIHFLISKNLFLISRNRIVFFISRNRIDFFTSSIFFISRSGFFISKIDFWYHQIQNE